MSIAGSTLIQNNLGGLGPDSGATELRVGPVGILNGRAFDLYIVNTSEYHSTSSDNGLVQDGQFLSLSVKEGTAVDLELAFVDSLTSSPVELPCLNLGIFGMGNGDN